MQGLYAKRACILDLKAENALFYAWYIVHTAGFSLWEAEPISS